MVVHVFSTGLIILSVRVSLYTTFLRSVFSFRLDVDQYCYTLELTVYLQFCLVGSSLPMLYVLKTHSWFGRQISVARVGIE